MANKKKSVSSLFKRLDIFGQQLSFTIDGEEKYQTVLGAVLSICVLLLVLIQFSQKLDVLINKEDTNHMQTVEQGKNDGSTGIGYEETGFNIAFAFLRDDHFTTGERKIKEDLSKFVEPKAFM